MANQVVAGFRFAGVAAGIKKKGGRDIGIIVAETPVATAAVFTQNRVKAAPVRVSDEHLRRRKGRMRAVIVNSGNANACTGPQGRRDAEAMADQVARALLCAPSEVLVCSTGVIGQALPMPKVEAGIAAAAKLAKPGSHGDFAQAIMTTDKHAKMAKARVRIGGKAISLWGTTKGAGMIMPNMATTLTYVVTDANITPAALNALTRAATDATYNAIAVDGDTSTNDTLVVMASGLAGPRISSATSTQGKQLGVALTALLRELATKLMRDGEGVHHVVEMRVTGARTHAQAQTIARRIAISPLVKTAIAGGDPNWGRILCAVGNAGVDLMPDRLALQLGNVATVKHGALVANWNERAAAKVMKQPGYQITVDLGLGRASASYLACDLSHEYVSINADYRS